jgi:hypothetical protein
MSYQPSEALTVIAGLVPAMTIRETQSCPINRDGRDTGAFTPVFDGLCPAMTLAAWSTIAYCRVAVKHRVEEEAWRG